MIGAIGFVVGVTGLSFEAGLVERLLDELRLHDDLDAPVLRPARRRCAFDATKSWAPRPAGNRRLGLSPIDTK